MDDAKSDIMMYFVLNGSAVDAESELRVDSSDGFMDGFQDASYQDYSNFFEVSDFSFTLRLNAGEKDGGNVRKDSSLLAAAAGAAASRAGLGSLVGSSPAAKSTVKKDADEYERWRSATAEQLKTLKFPIEFGTFTFKRMLDAASPVFFESCANAKTFDQAVLVKRLQARGGSSFTSQGYMRILFTNVLLTKVSWEDGDIVKESCEFKCKQMDVRYKKQMMDGSLTGVVSRAAWDQAINGIPPGSASAQGNT